MFCSPCKNHFDRAFACVLEVVRHLQQLLQMYQISFKSGKKILTSEITLFLPGLVDKSRVRSSVTSITKLYREIAIFVATHTDHALNGNSTADER